ncbi:MAG: hypothetical protein AAB116_05545 [Candidatus Poribacteria bacterium]
MFERYFRKLILLLSFWDFCLGVSLIAIGHSLLKRYGVGVDVITIPAFFVYWSGFFIILQAVLHFFFYLDLYNSKVFWLNFIFRAPIGVFHLVQYLLFLHSIDPIITGALIFFICGDLSTGGLLLVWYMRKKGELKQ